MLILVLISYQLKKIKYFVHFYNPILKKKKKVFFIRSDFFFLWVVIGCFPGSNPDQVNLNPDPELIVPSARLD